MNSRNEALSLNLASIKNIDFLTEKMVMLHEFESCNDNANLKISDDFESQVRNWITLELQNPTSLLFLIEIDDNLIGFAFIKILPSQNKFTIHTSFGLLQSLWIEPEFQNKSYGQQTVGFIESIFKEQDLPYYEVNYSSTNITAEKFWRNCGLTPSAVTARKFLS